jgi:hypothetical protein
MLSGGADGERVEVVGEDAPGGPGAGSVVAFEAAAAQAVAAFEVAAAQAVAAFEVADAALGADPELRQAPVGLARPGRLSAGDEQSIGWRQGLGDRAGRETAVKRDFSGPDAQFVEPGAGCGQQVRLVGRPDLRGDREDEAAGAAPGRLAGQ